MPDEALLGLPKKILENIAIAHDGVLRFLQHDPGYFRGEMAKEITDNMAALARKLWIELTPVLDFENILGWLNKDFDVEHNGDQGIIELRDDWLGFLIRNREKLANLKSSCPNLRLLARLDGTEVWNSPEKTWLSDASPQGRDVEDFIANTSGVSLLSRHYETTFSGILGIDNAGMGSFFIQLGVEYEIKAEESILRWYDSVKDMNNFCKDLGISTAGSPQGDINYNMPIYQYSLPEDIRSAFNDALRDVMPQRRVKRLNAFARLIQTAWREDLSKKCYKEGRYHLRGAREDVKMPGEFSNISLMLRDTDWIPLMNDNQVLKRPRDTCLLTDESIKYADKKVVANYADVPIDDDSLIKFLGFQPLPVELSSLDALRTLVREWEKSSDPKKEFEGLYSRLLAGLDRDVNIEEAQYIFRKEKLIFIPTKPPILRSSEEVLVNANAGFRDFFDELSNYYSPDICTLFKRLGVADKVQDIHYLRYLVSYIWQEKPTLTEVRRESVLKVYRRLVEWAKDQAVGQGIWGTPEGKIFTQSTIFFGNCAGKEGWFQTNESLISLNAISLRRSFPTMARIISGLR